MIERLLFGNYLGPQLVRLRANGAEYYQITGLALRFETRACRLADALSKTRVRSYSSWDKGGLFDHSCVESW